MLLAVRCALGSCARRRTVIRMIHSIAGSQCLEKVGQLHGGLLRTQSHTICSDWINSTRFYSTELPKDAAPKEEAKTEQEQEDEPNRKNLTTKERLKIITTQYGAFGMAFHITISLASLGMFYFLVYSGVDFTALMTWLGLENTKIAAGASTMVVAYAVHKVFAPVRIGITFVSVPILVKHFRRIGFFKNK